MGELSEEYAEERHERDAEGMRSERLHEREP